MSELKTGRDIFANEFGNPLVSIFLAAILYCASADLVCVGLYAAGSKPNILFVAIDDFNDWGPSQLEGEPFEVATPNFDRLAERSIVFQNAHCSAPSCNPSRASIMSGLHPNTTGVYSNGQDWREVEIFDDILLLPEYFEKHGYATLGCGKIYHANESNAEQRRGFMSPRGWDAFYPSLQVQLPDPSEPENPPMRGVGKFNWGGTGKPLEEMGDHKVVNWAIDQLQQSREEPLFLAVGIYRPHMPWYVPDAFYDSYENVEIVPPVNPENWDRNIPEAMTNRRRFKEFAGKPGPSRGYAACMTYADYELGRLLDALSESSIADNTIVMVWSDHGWHLGEKEHFSKFTLWEESTRVPLVLSMPDGRSKEIDTAVSLLDVYPTLLDLAGLPINAANDGESLLPIVEQETDWKRAVVISSSRKQQAVRDGRYRYIQFNGVEALFDHETDPGEFDNLAQDPAYAEIVRRLAGTLP